MLRDAEHFKAKIGGLDGAGDAGDYVVKLVKDKKVPKTKPVASPPAAVKTDPVTNGKSSSEATPPNGIGAEKSDESTNGNGMKA